MDSKIRVIIAVIAAVVAILAAVSLASAAHYGSRPNYYTGTNRNYATYGGYSGQDAYVQAPHGNGYPQQGYGYGYGGHAGHGFGYGYPGPMMGNYGRGDMMGGW